MNERSFEFHLMTDSHKKKQRAKIGMDLFSEIDKLSAYDYKLPCKLETMSDESTDEDWVEEQSKNTSNASSKSSPIIQLHVEEFYQKITLPLSPTKIKLEFDQPFKVV